MNLDQTRPNRFAPTTSLSPKYPVRISRCNCTNRVDYAGIEIAPGRILTSANRIKCGDITGTAAFQEGRIAIQDEGSQLVAMLVGKGERILDCCAAPGGKTRCDCSTKSRSVNHALSNCMITVHSCCASVCQKKMSSSNRRRDKVYYRSSFRPRTSGCTVLRNWHAGAQSRNQMAFEARRSARPARASIGDPAISHEADGSRRKTDLCHLFTGAGRKRECSE